MNRIRFLFCFCVILLACFPENTNGFLDYTEERMMDCSIPVKDSERLNKFGLHEIDRYMFLILCPISIAATLFVIITFLKYPEAQKQPSDLLFCISISDLILTIHWFMQAIDSVIRSGQPPADDELFCVVNSFLSLFSGFAQFAYNLMFCAFLVTRIQNALRDFRLRKSFIHSAVILGSLGFYIFLDVTNRTSVNLYGMCSSRIDNYSWVLGVLALCVYLFFSWSTIIYFKKYVPNSKKFEKQRTAFLNFYLHYVLAISISWTILAISYTIIGLNCVYQFNPVINIFITIGNFFKLITPIILSAIRYKDPQLQQCISRRSNKFHESTSLSMHLNSPEISMHSVVSDNNNSNKTQASIRNNIKLKKVSSNTSSSDSINATDSDSHSPSEIENHIINISRTSSDMMFASWSHHLTFKLKIMRLQSIIAGLAYEEQLIERMHNSKSQPSSLLSQSTSSTQSTTATELTQTPPLQTSLSQPQKELSVHYNSNSLRAIQEAEGIHLSDEHGNNNSNNYIEIHEMKMKVYFPGEFAALRKRSSHDIDFKECLNFERNMEMVDRLTVIGDGGRSGEMLFFNHDQSLLLKTVSKNDVSSFVKFADSYFAYFKDTESSSLISKIYGLYSFTRKDANDVKTYLIFMRNLANIPKQLILRKFDLKGSTFDREVLTKYKIQTSQIPNHSNFEAFHTHHQNCFPHQDSLSSNRSKATSDIESSKQNSLSRSNSQIPSNVSTKTQQSFQWTNSYNQTSTKNKLLLDVSTITMKDIDFDKLEKHVHVSAKDGEFLRKTLIKDSLFFKKNGLIDYSLLVFKVAGNVKSSSSLVRELNQSESGGTQKKQQNRKDPFVFNSNREPNVSYRIGIIDYLQLWNIDKLLEQKAKQALHADLKLNVSSQNPDNYSSRFISNVVQKYFS